VFSELLAAYNARLIEGSGWIYALLNLPSQGDNWQEKLEEAVSNGRQILHDNFDLDLTIAISQRVQGLNRVRQAYVWARDTLAARQPGAEGLIAAWRREGGEQAREMLSGELDGRARRLEQLASSGDAEGAQEELKGFKKAAAHEPGWVVRLQCATLLQGILQNLSLRFSMEETEPLTQRVQQYMEAAPAGDGFGELGKIIAAACALSAAGGENVRRAEIARQAEAYIQENYAESCMSISRVADHLNLTASYVSALYKRQTGQAMLDTINLTRIRHAKLLLSGSHMSLEQVAEQVGYCDSSSFIRTFKKYEGQTPGQYRTLKARTGREMGA
jgi:AraC-like DNA-binding protein